PRLRVPSKLFLVPALPLAGASLLRILHCLLLVAPRERLEAWSRHASKVCKLADARDVYRAPKALWFSRGETIGVADIIYGLFYSVDPAETECFIHGFWIADSDFA